VGKAQTFGTPSDGDRIKKGASISTLFDRRRSLSEPAITPAGHRSLDRHKIHQVVLVHGVGLPVQGREHLRFLALRTTMRFSLRRS